MRYRQFVDRRKPEKPVMLIHARLPLRLYAAVKRLSEERGVSISEIVREALERYIEEVKG